MLVTAMPMLADCMDQGPFGLSQRKVLGPYSFHQWEDFETHYLTGWAIQGRSSDAVFARCWISFITPIELRIRRPEQESPPMNFRIELDREVDGRWIAEVRDLPGVMVYGKTRTKAIANVQALALHVIADRIEHGESTPDLRNITFKAA